MAKVAVKFSRPPGSATATFRLAQQAALEAMLRHWHATYLPLHFQLSATKRYGYQPRVGDDQGPKVMTSVVDPKTGRTRSTSKNNPAYSWVKRRKYHHNRPLVFTGVSERQATAAGNFVVRVMSGTRTRGAFVAMPDYWWKYHKGGVYFRNQWFGGRTAIVLKPQPNKAEELTRIIPSELADMARVGEQRITQFMQQYRPPTSGVA